MSGAWFMGYSAERSKSRGSNPMLYSGGTLAAKRRDRNKYSNSAGNSGSAKRKRSKSPALPKTVAQRSSSARKFQYGNTLAATSPRPPTSGQPPAYGIVKIKGPKSSFERAFFDTKSKSKSPRPPRSPGIGSSFKSLKLSSASRSTSRSTSRSISRSISQSGSRAGSRKNSPKSPGRSPKQERLTSLQKSVPECARVKLNGTEVQLSLKDRMKTLLAISKIAPQSSLCSMKFVSKILSKNSASDTIQLFGELAEEPVMVKLSFESTEVDDTRNEVEIDIYKKAINPLIIHANTPHVIACYGVITCDNLSDSLRTPFKAQLKNLIGNIQNINKHQANVLVLERAQGTTIWDLLYSGKVRMSERDILTVVFQVVWTLACFDRIGLIHSDMHMGNIFVDILDEPVTRTYRLDSKRTFRVKSKYYVRIFDFDRSYKKSTKYNRCVVRNPYLDTYGYCEEFGQCNKFTPKFDLSQFMRGLWVSKNTAAINIVYELFNRNTKYFNTVCVHEQIPCAPLPMRRGDDYAHCKIHEMADHEFPPVMDMLKNNIFKVFLMSSPTVKRAGAENLFTMPGYK